MLVLCVLLPKVFLRHHAHLTPSQSPDPALAADQHHSLAPLPHRPPLYIPQQMCVTAPAIPGYDHEITGLPAHAFDQLGNADRDRLAVPHQPQLHSAAVEMPPDLLGA